MEVVVNWHIGHVLKLSVGFCVGIFFVGCGRGVVCGFWCFVSSVGMIVEYLVKVSCRVLFANKFGCSVIW